MELTLVLEHWHKTPKGAYRKAKRSATVYSWEDLIEQMNAFEETGFGRITASDVKITFRCEKNNMKSTALYADVVKMAGDYIKELGGFEKLAEWGLF